MSSLPKIKCLLWQCCHHSILVQALLSKRGMDIPFLCTVCNNAPETIIHALRDCPKAQLFWSSFSLSFQSPHFLWISLGGLAEAKLQELQDLWLIEHRLGYYLSHRALDTMAILKQNCLWKNAPPEESEGQSTGQSNWVCVSRDKWETGWSSVKNPGSMASPFSQLVQVEYGWLLPG